MPQCHKAYGNSWRLVVKRCADGYEVMVGDGLHGNRCFYDIATKRLIGVEDYTDIPEYCDDTSYTLAAGTVFDCPADATIVLETGCIDADGSGGSGGVAEAGGSGDSMDSGSFIGSHGNVDDDSGTDDAGS